METNEASSNLGALSSAKYLGKYRVPLGRLENATDGYLLRRINDSHVEFLQTKFGHKTPQEFSNFLVCMLHRDRDSIDTSKLQEELNNTNENAITLGGNHTIKALKHLASSKVNGWTMDTEIWVLLYAKLTEAEAAFLSAGDNLKLWGSSPLDGFAFVSQYRQIILRHHYQNAVPDPNKPLKGTSRHVINEEFKEIFRDVQQKQLNNQMKYFKRLACYPPKHELVILAFAESACSGRMENVPISNMGLLNGHSLNVVCGATFARDIMEGRKDNWDEIAAELEEAVIKQDFSLCKPKKKKPTGKDKPVKKHNVEATDVLEDTAISPTPVENIRPKRAVAKTKVRNIDDSAAGDESPDSCQSVKDKRRVKKPRLASEQDSEEYDTEGQETEEGDSDNEPTPILDIFRYPRKELLRILETNKELKAKVLESDANFGDTKYLLFWKKSLYGQVFCRPTEAGFQLLRVAENDEYWRATYELVVDDFGVIYLDVDSYQSRTDRINVGYSPEWVMVSADLYTYRNKKLNFNKDGVAKLSDKLKLIYPVKPVQKFIDVAVSSELENHGTISENALVTTEKVSKPKKRESSIDRAVRYLMSL